MAVVEVISNASQRKLTLNLKKFIVVFFATSNFVIATCMSLLAPFYPIEAKEKGASAGAFGFVLGVFELVVFLVSPIISKTLLIVKPTFIATSGLLICGAGTIAFGFTNLIDNQHLFIFMSILLRCLQGVGEAAFTIADFSITSCLCPERVSTMFSIMETCWCLGIIVGPTLGGLLFQIGGFVAPFSLIGGFLLLYGLLSLWLMFVDLDFSRAPGRDTAGFWRLLKMPTIRYPILSILMTTFSFGYIDSVLGLHLQQYGLGPAMTGLVFITTGVTYGISSPIWGYLFDKKVTSYYGLIIGSSLQGLGFVFFGPTLFNGFHGSLIVDIFMQGVIGVGMGSVLIGGFTTIERISKDAGFNQDLNTYSIVSAVWTSVFSLGYFLGPTVMGLILVYQDIGATNHLVMTAFLILVIYNVAFIWKKKIPFLINKKLNEEPVIKKNYGSVGESPKCAAIL